MKKTLTNKSKIAFVCSGGAVKAGCFHLGVALALQEKGFRFRGGLKENAPEPSSQDISCYVGSSAGSFITAILASGVSLQTLFCSFLKKKSIDGHNLKPLSYGEMLTVNKPKHFLKNLSLPSVSQVFSTSTYKGFLKGLMQVDGFFNTQGIEAYLRKEVLVSNRFSELDPELYIVATRLNESKKVVFGPEKQDNPELDDCHYESEVSISQSAAASSALPPIYSPYGIENKEGELLYFFDGEIRETLSSHVAVDHGADLIFASYTHQPYHYDPEFGSLTKLGIPAIMIQALYMLVEKKIQSHRNSLSRKFAVLESVSEFCDEKNFDEETKKQLLELLQEKLAVRPEVDVVHIHPSPDDREMFFGNHFSLKPKGNAEIVKTGYKRALEVLDQYEFDL